LRTKDKHVSSDDCKSTEFGVNLADVCPASHQVHVHWLKCSINH